MKISQSLIAGTVTLLIGAPTAHAAVKPAALFSDHMVLQQSVAAPVWGWADPGEKVTVTLGAAKAQAVAGSDGKWSVKLTTPAASANPTDMTIAGPSNTIAIHDVLIGEVWLASGQSNMEFTVSSEHKSFAGVQNMDEEIKAANWPQIRMFVVPMKMADQPQPDAAGAWSVCSPATVGDMSAAAYFFARELYQDRHVPVGIVNSSFGGSAAQSWIGRDALVADPKLKPLVDSYEAKIATWTPEAAKSAYDAELAKWQADTDAAKAAGKKAPRKPKEPRNPHQDQHNPYLLYNAMIDPIKGYAIRGAIWYQGESNIPTVGIYADMMSTLITSWRTAWGEGAFPFIQVQLAAYGKATSDPVQLNGGTAAIRQAQLESTQATPNAFLATAVDIGDTTNIHPKNKQEVGRRLGLIARSEVYKEANLEDSGPVFSGLSISGNTVTIKFTHVDGGLDVHGDTLSGFAISEDGKAWIKADAKIVGDTVVVTSDQVAKPTAVRYAWQDYPTCTLFNKPGLPALPFASDLAPVK